MRRFPLRTLVLMVIALAAFLRLYYVTHTRKAPEPPPAPVAAPAGPAVEVAPPTPGQPPEAPSPACQTLEQALLGAIRTPDDPKAIRAGWQQLEGCPMPPQRACELGTPMAARSPMSAGDTPLRGLLAGLCQQCAPAMNPCAQSFSQTLVVLGMGRSPDLAELRWNLENAGPGRRLACDSFVRSVLVPAALSTETLSPAKRSVLDVATPLCAQDNPLPAALVNAALVQQGGASKELAKFAVNPAATPGPLPPDELVGPEARRHAFDANEKTAVELSNTVTSKRWEADGALRAQFTPPLKQLASVRVRASGPGTLRAIIRTPQGVGLKDPERGMHFVHPTACRFKGTGQWETCKLAAPLVDVDALSVFPEQKGLTLYEVEALGKR